MRASCTMSIPAVGRLLPSIPTMAAIKSGRSANRLDSWSRVVPGGCCSGDRTAYRSSIPGPGTVKRSPIQSPTGKTTASTTGKLNARNLLFHLGRRIHCGAGLGRGKGGWPLRSAEAHGLAMGGMKRVLPDPQQAAWRKGAAGSAHYPRVLEERLEPLCLS